MNIERRGIYPASPEPGTERGGLAYLVLSSPRKCRSLVQCPSLGRTSERGAGQSWVEWSILSFLRLVLRYLNVGEFYSRTIRRLVGERVFQKACIIPLGEVKSDMRATGFLAIEP